MCIQYAPKMKILLIFTLLGTGLHGSGAVRHSLRYFYTASRGIPSFPEFVTIGMVNEQPISYYDSVQKREVPKQEWMKQNEKPDYWERQTEISIAAEQKFKASIDSVSQRLNQTKGPHIVQNLYGCEWDDETNEVHGFNQFGYNGEDYIVFNLETETWIAPRPQAVITKMKWDRDELKIDSDKNYLTHTCVDWLKKYLKDGADSLMKTVLPSISLLQKSSSSPVTCHATGFYPDRAMLFWTKDGKELDEGVDLWEVLPNHDGTFQQSADLDVSSIPPEDWVRYNCVFQLSGVKQDVLTKLDKAKIRTNEKKNTLLSITAVVVGICVIVVAALGFVLYKKKIAKCPPTPVSEPEVKEELDPKSYRMRKGFIFTDMLHF